jgi:hypothetical protein
VIDETLRRFGDEIEAAAPLGRVGGPRTWLGRRCTWPAGPAPMSPGAVLPVDGGITL